MIKILTLADQRPNYPNSAVHVWGLYEGTTNCYFVVICCDASKNPNDVIRTYGFVAIPDYVGISCNGFVNRVLMSREGNKQIIQV